MKRIGLFLTLAALTVVLCSCAAPQETAPVPQATAAPAQALSFPQDHPLGAAASQVLSPYESCLQNIAAQGVTSISHRIPQDMFSQLISSAQAQNITAAGSRYSFTTVQTGTHTYQATAMEATDGLDPFATPEPGNETPMDSTRMGDYSVTGGGVYHRTHLWDVKEDLSQGSIEIITTLNGESAGHETFTFASRSDGFYFVDVAPDLAVTLDTLQSSGTYLVAVGRFTPERVEVVEYHVQNLYEAPDPASMDFDAIKNTVNQVSYLNATQDQVVFH